MTKELTLCGTACCPLAEKCQRKVRKSEFLPDLSYFTWWKHEDGPRCSNIVEVVK